MKIKYFFSIALILLFSSLSEASLKILATYPYLAEITKQIVKKEHEVIALAGGNVDPHFVIAKPSLIALARRADLLISNGAELEVGWLPQVIRQANNPKIVEKNFLEASKSVELIERPVELSRDLGDIHPEGNPHFHLDPYNIIPIADAITDKLCEIDAQGCNFYRENNNAFKLAWKTQLSKWDQAGNLIRGKKVVQYHTLFNYLFRRYGVETIGTIEPLPGIPPSTSHLEKLAEKIRSTRPYLIIQSVYHSQKASKMLSERTGVPFVVIPHDVNATEEAKDLYSLFDVIFQRLLR